MSLKFVQLRTLSSLSASITKPHRNTYTRTFPTILVNPNGSTINIRFLEPRQIIKLPINIWILSEAERKSKIDQRKPKKKRIHAKENIMSFEKEWKCEFIRDQRNDDKAVAKIRKKHIDVLRNLFIINNLISDCVGL
ncbi:hypothetical protein NQ317_016890 [Molorchus minor]|uniref:39S ribosomal protein L55, mitochondrial n=1 Tax=Molorchus minor TaxID=1323400 RepID=A0ABQ9K3T2_9CUCU|nr:hypothetical protein NQ317_016890 [Molorchus minor]